MPSLLRTRDDLGEDAAGADDDQKSADEHDAIVPPLGTRRVVGWASDFKGMVSSPQR
ncbi:hypothetical protein GCM10017691_37420 [Pseudonocardia petroleophila]